LENAVRESLESTRKKEERVEERRASGGTGFDRARDRSPAPVDPSLKTVTLPKPNSSSSLTSDGIPGAAEDWEKY